jgi:hypothetical protein
MSPVETIIETIADGDHHQKIIKNIRQIVTERTHPQIGRKHSENSEINELIIIQSVRCRNVSYTNEHSGDDDGDDDEEFDDHSSTSLSSSITTNFDAYSVKSSSDSHQEDLNDDDKCNQNHLNNNSNLNTLKAGAEEQTQTLTNGRSNNSKYKYCSTKNTQKTIHRSLLFGIQLEVTSLLLEAERRKLNVLQRELKLTIETDGTVRKTKELAKQELIQAIT